MSQTSQSRAIHILSSTENWTLDVLLLRKLFEADAVMPVFLITNIETLPFGLMFHLMLPSYHYILFPQLE